MNIDNIDSESYKLWDNGSHIFLEFLYDNRRTGYTLVHMEANIGLGDHVEYYQHLKDKYLELIA